MPCLKILTNIPKSKIPKDFLVEVIPVLVEGVKKQPEKFICTIQGDVPLTLEGNSTLPGVVASLESIGHLGPDENKIIAKLLTTFIEKSLGVEPNRFFLTFYDLKSYNVAKGGVTIDTVEK